MQDLLEEIGLGECNSELLENKMWNYYDQRVYLQFGTLVVPGPGYHYVG